MRDFNHTVNVLVKAYLNDTLVKGNYCQCAVGNLIQEAHKITLLNPSKDEIDEDDKSVLNGAVWYSAIQCKATEFKEAAYAQIKPIGYTFEEVFEIERAFEKGAQTIFESLMAVVDVLAEIHNIDLTAKEEAKKLFVKVETL